MKQVKLLNKFLSPFQKKYQEGLEQKMRSKFVFENVELLHYKLHKISLNRGGSYVDSPEWLKNKKATINPKNNDEKCFQYALTVALNYQNIKNNPERITKIKPSTNICEKKKKRQFITSKGIKVSIK